MSSFKFIEVNLSEHRIKYPQLNIEKEGFQLKEFIEYCRTNDLVSNDLLNKLEDFFKSKQQKVHSLKE